MSTTLFRGDIYQDPHDPTFKVWDHETVHLSPWRGRVICRAGKRQDTPDPKAGKLYKGDLYRDHTCPAIVQEWSGSDGYIHSIGTKVVCRAADRENYLTPPAPATETKSERAKRDPAGPFYGFDLGLGRDFWSSLAPCYIHDERIVFEPKPAPKKSEPELMTRHQVRRMIDEALYAARVKPHADGSLHIHDWGTGNGVKSKETNDHFAKAASEVVRIGTPKVPTVEDLTKQVETLKLELEAARAHANGGAR